MPSDSSCKKKFHIINYIDDLIGFGLPSNIHKSFEYLCQHLHDLGLTISQKKIVEPSTLVTCLGVQINTEEGTIAIPPQTLMKIKQMSHNWGCKKQVQKHHLQSLLGSLLHITKCVNLFIWDLRRFQHCTGHIMTGSWKGRGNQYIEFARVLYCKLPTNGKQLPAFLHKALTGTNPGLRGGRQECYHSATAAPTKCVKNARVFLNRMLQNLRNAEGTNLVQLDNKFYRELNWFKQFFAPF